MSRQYRLLCLYGQVTSSKLNSAFDKLEVTSRKLNSAFDKLEATLIKPNSTFGKLKVTYKYIW